jgi:diaminopimelate epimerase
LKLSFHKYQGTGNDFVLLNNFHNELPELSQAQVAFLCNRRFGIGADGLIILQAHKEFDFEMVYYNADGAQSSMCGNGGRCAAQFAFDQKHTPANTLFWAIDGLHEAAVAPEGVLLKMIDVAEVRAENNGLFLNTGSPHFIKHCEAIHATDVAHEGAAIRNSAPYAQDGVNVNFVMDTGTHLHVRTYERGVEAETLSCGTGVTAAALAKAWQEQLPEGAIPIVTPGGALEVRFQQTAPGKFEQVYLFGPATFVFEGTIELPC